VRAYRTFEHKMRDARAHKQVERIPWPVVADDLEGTTHQVYSGLADPTLLIDADGRVAFYNMWTYAPSLHRAIEALLEQDGRGVVFGGIDRVPHLQATVVHGWKGIRRGLPQSFVELELASPGMGLAIWLGYQLRAFLEPLVIRSRPLPAAVRAVLWGTAALLGIAAVRRWRR
jgi:hypothetical protein